MAEYPEHARQAKVLDEAQAIGQFLDESGYILAEYQDVGWSEDQLMPVHTSITRILADYFGIDLNKIEAEKRQMIAVMRGVS